MIFLCSIQQPYGRCRLEGGHGLLFDVFWSVIVVGGSFMVEVLMSGMNGHLNIGLHIEFQRDITVRTFSSV